SPGRSRAVNDYILRRNLPDEHQLNRGARQGVEWIVGMQDSFGIHDIARRDMGRCTSRRGFSWINPALTVVSVLLSLAVVEVAYRLSEGVPVVKLVDWRSERILVNRIGAHRAIPDPILGWTLKPWHDDADGYSTIDYGIRSNFGER